MKTAGRKANKVDISDVIDPQLDQPKINGAMALMRADATDVVLVQAQHDSHVRAVALQLGYQLPADCTDPDLIQRQHAPQRRGLFGSGARAGCIEGRLPARKFHGAPGCAEY